jgi:hypothetical protein
MKNIKIIMPQGALGKYEGETELETLLRKIAVKYSKDRYGECAEKYGTEFENDEFMMHRFCWCDEDDCGWCEGNKPNFLHKKTGFEVKWYKYIGRSMEINMKPPIKELKKLLK